MGPKFTDSNNLNQLENATKVKEITAISSNKLQKCGNKKREEG